LPGGQSLLLPAVGDRLGGRAGRYDHHAVVGAHDQIAGPDQALLRTLVNLLGKLTAHSTHVDARHRA